MAFQNVRREWKNHKYIRKEGNRYIYPEDLRKSQRSMSSLEYKTRMQDGSLDRMRGQVTQEAAKKQGQYSINMMRQEKRENAVNNQGSVNYKQLGQQKANRTAAANGAKELYRMNDGSYVREHGRSDQEFAKNNAQVSRKTVVSTPANRARQSTNQNVSTAAKQAMERAGYKGPVQRPQNQNVKSVQKKVETKETKTPDKTTKTTTSTLTTTDDDKKKTTTTKSTSTSSGTSSSGSSKTSSSSRSSSGTIKSSGSGSRSGGGSVSKSSGIGGYSGARSSSSKSSSKASSGGSSGGFSNTDAEEAAEIKEKLANGDLDIDSLSKSAIDILSDSLGGLLDSGKIESKTKGTLKLKDSEDFVKAGLSILKKFS